MNPKSGKKGSIKMPPDPIKAGDTVDPKSGEAQAAQANAIKKKSQKYGSVKVGEPVVPKAKPVKTSPANVASANKNSETKPVLSCPQPCVFKDSEGRHSSSSLVLEIVPPPLSSNDTIKMVPQGSQSCACSGMRYQLDGGAKLPLSSPANVSGTAEIQKIEKLSDISRVFHFSPRKSPVHLVCGKDGSSLASGELRIYPSSSQKVSWNSTECLKKHPGIAKFIEGLSEFASKISGREVNPIKGFSVSTGMLYVSIAAPEFTFEFEGAWNEYENTNTAKHWQAYYGFKLTLAGKLFEITCKVDLVHALSYMPALVPFKPIFDQVWDRMRDSLTSGNGPPFFLGCGGALTGSVTLERKPDWQPAGGIKLSGSLFLGVMIKNGLMSAELNANTGLSADVEARGMNEQAFLIYNAFKFEGVKGKISISIDSGWVGQWGYEQEVEIMKGSEKGWPLTDQIPLF